MGGWMRSSLVCLALSCSVAATAASAAGAPPSQAAGIAQALLREDHVRAERLARAWLADADRGADAAQQLAALDALVDALLDGERVDTADLDALLAREEVAALELRGAGSHAQATALLRKATVLLLRREFPAFTRAIHEAAETGACAPAAADPVCAELDLQTGFSLTYLEREPKQGQARVQTRLKRLKSDAAVDPRVTSRALRLYARMLFDGRQLDAALSAMRTYEAHARSVFGERSAHRSDALTWLGYTLRESGRYAEGIAALREGADIAAQLRPYRQRLHVDALIALGQNLGIVGETDKARIEFERALAIEEKRQTTNGYLYGLVLNSLGTLHGNLGDHTAASGYFARAVPIYERVFGVDSPKTIIARKNHAETLQGLGRLDDAAAIYAAIVADHDRDPDAQPGSVALLPYKNFATLRLWQGRYVEAEALYRRFLALLGDGRDFNEVNPRTATAGLAAALWGQGRHADAFEQAVLAQRIAARARRNALDQLSEREVLAFERSQYDVAGLAVAIAADAGDAAMLERAWDLELQGSGEVTRAMATRLARAHARTADAALWEEWRAAGATLAAARVEAARAGGDAAIDAVDRAQDGLDALERRLAAAEPAAAGVLAAQLGDFASVRAHLPEGALLVRFVEVADHAPDRYQRTTEDADPHLYALVARERDAVRAVDLGAVRTIAERVEAWYALASDPHGDARATSVAAKALRRALYDPLAGASMPRRGFFVPSATLDRLNFAALQDEQGRLLVESGPPFHLLNHERELLLAAPARRAPTLLLAGAADPAPADAAAITSRLACAGLERSLATSLPGARREIERLRELAQDHAERIDVLSGNGADEAAVRAAMPGHSIVHLATHAFTLAQRCGDGNATMRSIGLDAPQASAAQASVSSIAADLSALAFLPRATDSAADDGLLTSEEVVTLDLSRADWVVLSACETALGRHAGSEGVFGLRRAFRLAGARTVVMSLWKVEDEATAEFMQALYRARLVDALDAPDAMQAAMRATLAARRARGQSTHPLYWAGFVAAGAWR